MDHLSDFIHYSAEDFAANESFQGFASRSDAEAVRFWENWVLQHPEKQTEISEALELLSLLYPNRAKRPAQEKDDALRFLFSSLNQGEQPIQLIPDTEGQPDQTQGTETPEDEQETPWWERSRMGAAASYPQWRLVAAACVSLLLLAGLGYFFMARISQEEVRYATAYGQTTTVVLPDSSIVTLNGNSTLRHAAAWNQKTTRQVWVAGEAFFEVRHKGQGGNAKFVVHTRGLDVEVLGTKFNVFDRDDKVNVILNSGKVKVNITSQKDTSTLIMRPGETVEFFRKSDSVVKKPVNAEVLTSWRNKVLVFENTPLYKIGEIIEYTYGLNVVFSDSLQANQKVVGTIPSDNLEVLLTALAKSSNLSITRDNNQIRIENGLPQPEND